MAVRPVYIPKNSAPFYDIVNIEFKWNGGFAVSQKQKNIKAIHDGFKLIYPEANPLEISSKSLIQTGVELSAFNLMKYVPELKKSFPIENVYQAGKVFENGCQYTDLMLVSPKDAKRDERLKNSGKLTMFRFSGQNFPLIPESLFYNYIYIWERQSMASIARLVGYEHLRIEQILSVCHRKLAHYIASSMRR